MRFVLCDDDALFSSVIDSVVTSLGHDVVGVADNVTTGCALIERAKPDAVVVDPAIGVGSDYDIVATALDCGARVVVFSRSGSAVLGPRPVAAVVAKPDVVTLEEVIRELDHVEPDDDEDDEDRRRRPTVVARGPKPTGPTDAAAFYEALHEATEGDAIVRIVPLEGRFGIELPDLASGALHRMRGGDRLLVSSTALVALLPGGGEPGAAAIIDRMRDDVLPDGEVAVAHVVVAAGESPDEAFERLRRL